MHCRLDLIAIVLLDSLAPRAWADAVERMRPEKLRATHEQIEALKTRAPHGWL